MNTDISRKICSLIGELTGHEFEEQEMTSPSFRALNAAGCDSLDTVEIVMLIENTYNISIPDSDFESYDMTLGELVKLVEKRLPRHANKD